MTFGERTNSRPHAGRNGLLLFADRIGIDGGDFQDGVAHPLGEEMQGDPLVERMDGIAVAQALGDTMWPGSDVRLCHHGDDTPPRRGTRPGPQRLIECGPPTAALDFFQTVDHVERIQQGERYRDGAVHTFPTFFEAFHNDDLVGKIHASRGEVEGFRNTAPRVIQETAKGAHRPIMSQGGAEERLALARGEVEASAKGIVEIGGAMHTATEYKPSGAIARHGAR